jgi:hypothetical protein
MSKKSTYELGTYRGRSYFLHIRGNPSLESPNEFAVVVYYKNGSTGDEIQIVRVDTKHGYVHMDMLYRSGGGRKPFDGGLWDAVEHFFEKWRQYAESFENVYGWPKQQP